MATEDKDKIEKAPAPARRTMAPASRNPAGEDDSRSQADPLDTAPTRVGGVDLDDLSDEDLDELDGAVRAARRRRARDPRPPSFGMSEGERDELERTGKTVSPFTGQVRTRDDVEGDGEGNAGK